MLCDYQHIGAGLRATAVRMAGIAVCVLLLALGLLLRAAPNAHADTRAPGPVDVYVVVAPLLDWSDINAEDTPALYGLVETCAVGNVVSKTNVDYAAWEENESVHYRFFEKDRAAAVEYAVADILSVMDNNDSLVITSSASFMRFEEELFGEDLFILKDVSDNGLLTSGTTRQTGLITSYDAEDAVNALVECPQRNPASLRISLLSSRTSADARLAQLARSASMAESLALSKDQFAMRFAICFMLALACSAVLLFLHIRRTQGLLKYLLPFARVLWIVTLSMPLATFLMFPLLPSLMNAEIALDYCMFTTACISLVVLIVALVVNWRGAYVFILVATLATLLLDQLTGGALSLGAYLSYSPLLSWRYYGIGNEGAALLYGAWLVFFGLLLTWRKDERSSQMLRKWVFPFGTIVVMVVIALPWLGANFGVVLWGSISAYVAWRLFQGKRITAKSVIGIVCVAVCCAAAVLFLDTTFNGESHMGGQIDFATDAWVSQLIVIFKDVGQLGIDTLTYSPALSVGFVALMAFMLVLIVKQPGAYKEFWRDVPDCRRACIACLVAALVMLLVEDSGILMPSLLFLYPISNLVWMLCDYHSWHIRGVLMRRWRKELEENSFAIAGAAKKAKAGAASEEDLAFDEDDLDVFDEDGFDDAVTAGDVCDESASAAGGGEGDARAEATSDDDGRERHAHAEATSDDDGHAGDAHAEAASAAEGPDEEKQDAACCLAASEA